METVLQEIERALQARVYYLALVVALTLPDICAALESPDGQTDRDRYKVWYNANLGGRYGALTDADCYSLRCGVVHQGRFGHPKMGYGRVVFSLPGTGIFLHNNIVNDALKLDVGQFCRDMVQAARRWFASKQNDPTVQANLPNLVQLRPQGLAPYIVGMPLIA
jgi:hypothetical protein